ncbi:MAG TPA: glycoside hydrolase family 2 TIM barrel-domain containing protein [Verrucomicrobiota bacterium]|nr:glycoside hydrolase family 2 TIM barrel-domain containing protein [Verrucomicrobiota bacterium]HQL79050.1 glycoside hydrolase family 2 TIM barrel-domain containing protein [Verrucomicrobiota bacterium]
MKQNRWLVGLLALMAVLLACHAARALEFEKLLAITTADSVRIEVVPKPGAGLGGLEFRAAITRADNGRFLWQGPLGQIAPDAAQGASFAKTISDLKPVLWCPESPVLYNIEVSAAKGDNEVASGTVRIGFRSFEIRDGQFHLNGRPVFLRGIAINPPDRTIPPEVGESRAFAEAYVRYLKSRNVNIFRLTGDESQVWFDVCDELGMMMYAGRYGAPPGTDSGKRVVPRDTDRCIAGYRRLFERCASHPCIVLYVLANELPVSGSRGKAFSELLTRALAELKAWDPTRPYIGNAGYGEGREGDVCDVHRYWGWYYNSFLTYYNLRDKLYPQPLFGDPAKNQPLTFTECVGSFTGWKGEFNIIRIKQLAPQLGWIGHTAHPREDALDYQAFMVKQAAESFRRMRPLNARLSGLMPFTILFHNWSGISSFEQMKPKPAMEQLGVSYQPVLLSWELWTPQVYAGTQTRAFAHVINDADNGAPLTNATLLYQVQTQGGRRFCQGTMNLPPIPYYGTWRKAIEFDLPPAFATAPCRITGSIISGNRILSTNSVGLFVAGAEWQEQAPRPGTPVHLYDPPGRTVAALRRLGIGFEQVLSLSAWPARMSALVIGEEAAGKVPADQRQRLQRFVRDGGRVLCLRPDVESFEGDWLPQKVAFLEGSANDTPYPPRTRPFAEQMNVNPERPNHPVFMGLDRQRLALWSDYGGWDQSKPGFPRVYPVTAGFRLQQPEALARTAILADYDRGLEGIALCEMFDGAGSVILSGFDLVSRAGLDPAADRLLANLIAYTASKENHAIHPLIESPIVWGDYPTERGVVCGSLNGLIVNAEWLAPPTNPSATPLPPNSGSWNMDPGSQFVPRGRNPFGPHGYSTASSLKDLNRESETGSGVFWASLPPGRKSVLTKVRNPATRPGQLTITVNGKTVTGPTAIAAGQTVDLRSPLPADATEVSVRYAGTKTLVLLETRFE